MPNEICVADQYMALVRLWADQRNITEGSTVQAQCLKLLEELGEFYNEYVYGIPEKYMSELGDVIVVGTIMAHQLGYSMTTNEMLNYSDTAGLPTVVISGRLCEAVSKSKDKHVIYSKILNVLYRACLYQQTNGVLSKAKAINDIEYALSLAYNKIKDRRGKMVNGVFVKEEDLNEA